MKPQRPSHTTQAQRRRLDFLKRAVVWVFIFIFVFSVAGGLIVLSGR